jgi:hypothetical protein
MKDKYLNLIYDALQKASNKNIDIYTFSMYHDHESGYVTICIDTEENSKKSVIQSNNFTNEYFIQAIKNKDIKEASSWQAIGGRSFMLGDFYAKNISEIQVSIKKKSDEFYLDMVAAVFEMTELISRQSSYGKQLMFSCSTYENEVGLVWSA